jgi:hypothetical protein
VARPISGLLLKLISSRRIRAFSEAIFLRLMGCFIARAAEQNLEIAAQDAIFR